MEHGSRSTWLCQVCWVLSSDFALTSCYAATWRYWSCAGPSSESRVASTSTFCLQSRLYESWCKSVCPKVRTLLHNLNLNRIQDIISTHIKKEQHSLWRLKSISYREGRALTINTFKEGRRALLVQKEEPMKCDALSNQFIDNFLLCRHHVQQYLLLIWNMNLVHGLRNDTLQAWLAVWWSYSLQFCLARDSQTLIFLSQINFSLLSMSGFDCWFTDSY